MCNAFIRVECSENQQIWMVGRIVCFRVCVCEYVCVWICSSDLHVRLCHCVSVGKFGVKFVFASARKLYIVLLVLTCLWPWPLAITYPHFQWVRILVVKTRGFQGNNERENRNYLVWILINAKMTKYSLKNTLYVASRSWSRVNNLQRKLLAFGRFCSILAQRFEDLPPEME